jgi:ABC-type antimicrobial peptide transport system permease subunit
MVSGQQVIGSECVIKPRRPSGLKRFVRVFFGRKIVIFGFVVIGLLVISALFAPFLVP